MGSCSSTPSSNHIPDRPHKEIYYVRYAGQIYGTETYKIFTNTLTNAQLQHYIIRLLYQYKCHYEYLDYNSIILYNIPPITFNNMFANLKLVETIDMPNIQQVVPLPSAPTLEDPI